MSPQIVAVTDCRGLPFVITSSDNAIFEYAPELDTDESVSGVGGACQGVHVKAAGNQGFAQIGASLTATKDVTLTAETTTGAFKPLIPVLGYLVTRALLVLVPYQSTVSFFFPHLNTHLILFCHRSFQYPMALSHWDHPSK